MAPAEIRVFRSFLAGRYSFRAAFAVISVRIFSKCPRGETKDSVDLCVFVCFKRSTRDFFTTESQSFTEKPVIFFRKQKISVDLCVSLWFECLAEQRR